MLKNNDLFAIENSEEAISRVVIIKTTPPLLPAHKIWYNQ